MFTKNVTNKQGLYSAVYAKELLNVTMISLPCLSLSEMSHRQKSGKINGTLQQQKTTFFMPKQTNNPFKHFGADPIRRLQIVSKDKYLFFQ